MAEYKKKNSTDKAIWNNSIDLLISDATTQIPFFLFGFLINFV